MKTILGAISSNQNTLGDIFFISTDLGRHFCSYFKDVCPDFQGFCEGFHRFPPIFGNFSGLLPNQNFCGCACTPVSYTTAINICGLLLSLTFFLSIKILLEQITLIVTYIKPLPKRYSLLQTENRAYHKQKIHCVFCKFSACLISFLFHSCNHFHIDSLKLSRAQPCSSAASLWFLTGYVRPSLGFRCDISSLYTDNMSLF